MVASTKMKSPPLQIYNLMRETEIYTNSIDMCSESNLYSKISEG